jgi:hypothetical protein
MSNVEVVHVGVIHFKIRHSLIDIRYLKVGFYLVLYVSKVLTLLPYLQKRHHRQPSPNRNRPNLLPTNAVFVRIIYFKKNCR